MISSSNWVINKYPSHDIFGIADNDVWRREQHYKLLLHRYHAPDNEWEHCMSEVQILWHKPITPLGQDLPLHSFLWHDQIETIFALLVHCEGNYRSMVDSSAKGQLYGAFMWTCCIVDLCLNKLVNKHSTDKLRRYYNAQVCPTGKEASTLFTRIL